MGLTHRLVAVLIVYLSGAIDSEHILLLEDLAGTLKPIRGPTIRTVVIASPDTILPEMIGLPTLRDSKRTFVQNYAASTGAGYLIRPDSYIGYHARPLTEASLLEYLREAAPKLREYGGCLAQAVRVFVTNLQPESRGW